MKPKTIERIDDMVDSWNKVLRPAQQQTLKEEIIDLLEAIQMDSGPVVEILQAGGIIHCRQGGELFLHPNNEVEWKADGIGIAGFQLPQHVYFCSTYRTLPAESQADLPAQGEG